MVDRFQTGRNWDPRNPIDGSKPVKNKNIDYFEEDRLIEPVTLPPGVTNDDVLNPKPEYASISKEYEGIATRFEEIYRSAIFPDDFLIINDVILTGVPTTSIKFINDNGSFVAETLRTKAPVVTQNNAQSLSVQLSLIFDSSKESMEQLRRLISVISVHPLMYVYNNKIRKNLGIKYDETTIFILDYAALRNSEETVGTIILDLTMHYFNYKPYSNHYWYNTVMPGIENTREKGLENALVRRKILNNSLSDLTGYQPSDFTIKTDAEDLINEMKIGSYRLDAPKVTSQNVPTPFPGSSETWMYLADHLYEQSNILSDENSDYVGFELTEYEQITPPKEAQVSEADAKEVLQETENRFPKYAEFYKAKKLQEQVLSKTASERAVEAYSNPYTSSTGPVDGIEIYFPKTNTHKRYSLSEGDLLTEIRNLGTSQDTKNKLIAQNRSLDSITMDPNVRYILLDVAELFPENQIIITKSVGAGDGPHGTGEGLDLRVQGVTKEDLFYKMKEVKGWGKAPGKRAILYTKDTSNFCHFDVRKQRFQSSGSFFQIDKSPKGETGKQYYLTGNELDKFLRDLNIEFQTQGIHNTSQTTTAFWNEERDYIDEEYKKDIDNENKKESLKKVKNATARARWIRDVETTKDLTYYWKDSKIKNVFYRKVLTNVSGKYNEQKPDKALVDIVCSSISLSFGHRIVPQRLLGQDSCTWQFLGPGNKSGTMAFTFSGKKGRESSDFIKSLFHRSRNNYKLFGSVISDAGNIRLNRDNPFSKGTNNLLALLNIENIVISEIQEYSIPNTTDQHQLVITFINQEFQEPGVEKKFLIRKDTKKKVMARLLDFVKPYKIANTRVEKESWGFKGWRNHYGLEVRDNYLIKPNTDISSGITQRTDKERTYNNSKYPFWLIVAIERTAELCNRLNVEMPPSKWQVSTNSAETWFDRYAELGAEEVMLGQVKNIDRQELNKNFFNVGLSSQQATQNSINNYYAMYDNKFDRNGGPKTNETHQRIYRLFLDEMSKIVDDVRKYMIDDKEKFKEIFGSIADELLSSVLSSIGNCYDDLNMPNVPNGNLALPPEFYIFDDSGEDPVVSGLTDDYNMEKYLERHLQNERASIRHYLKDHFLGGSYLSKNLPKVLSERAKYVNQFEAIEADQTGTIGEYDFLNPEYMLTEGTKSWDPLYYIPSETNADERSVLWKTETVDKNYQQSIDQLENKSGIYAGEAATRYKFMDNILALSPYLKHGRGEAWEKPYNSNNAEVIEAVYDDDWRNLKFGPNPDNATVDEKNNGFLASTQTLRGREIQKFGEAKDLARDREKTVIYQTNQGVQLQVLPNGNVMVGDSAEIEKEIEQKEAGSRLKAFELAAANIESRIRKGNTKEKEVYIERHLNKTYGIGTSQANATQIYSAVVAYNNSKFSLDKKEKKRKFFQQLSSSFANHEQLYSDLKGDIDNKIVKMVKGIAFGTKAKDLSVRRAYPTFKIFFIEEDSNETEQIDGEVLRAFDDFYSYSSIQEIKVTRSRKIAGDLAVIRMTNVGGKLLKKRYGDAEPFDSIKGESSTKYGVKTEYATGFLADTEAENPWEKIILKDGVKTQIRLGFANDPDNLETVFLGEIVEIAPMEDGKIIEIVCQGYGAELEGVELGPLEDGPTFYSSQQALSASIIQDSIVHFGRRNKYNKFTGGKRHAFTGGLGKGLAAQTLTDLFGRWGQDHLYKLFYRYKFLNYPQDDNIYAPPPSVYASTWMRFWNNACIYRPLNQTPWEIFKEHELRHPGYVSLAVPYGHSPRMTMFFGAKGQHYWSRPPSEKEIFLSEVVNDNVLAGRGVTLDSLKKNPYLIQDMKELASTNSDLARAILLDLSHFGEPVSSAQAIGELFGRYVPFRNYHYFDAAHHILKNNIRTSKDGVFNEIEVLYFDDENKIQEQDSDSLLEYINQLVHKGAATEACKLDDNLPEKHIRSYTREFPSCITRDMAKRYIQGLFARHLRDAYKGELIVLGEPTLKPYDIAFLSDTSIDMHGPIEVEAVTHIFNRDNGFISIITPDLCVDINDYYSATVFDLAGAAHSALHLDSLNAAPVLGTAVSAISYLALAGAVKFMQWTQDGVPVITSPLTLAGKPFMSVAIGYENASLFSCWGGQWRQKWDDFETGWRKFDLAETLFDTSLSWREQIATFFSGTKGPGYSTERL